MKRIITVLGLLLLACAPAWGKTYKIASFPIPLMVENSDKGVFVDLTREIAKRAGVDIEIVIYPTKRTVKMFHDGAVAGFFPALDVMIDKDISRSSEIYIKEDYAFTRKDTPQITNISELAGKTVGITLGYPYVRKITDNSAFTLANAPQDVLNMKKLAAKRIDVFVVEEKSGLKALKESGVSNVTYPAGHPLSQQKVYYAFQPGNDGKMLADKFSQALESMKKDGTFAAIMAKAQK